MISKANTSLGAMLTLLLGATLALGGCAALGEGEDTRGAPDSSRGRGTSAGGPQPAPRESEPPGRAVRPDPSALRFDTGDIEEDRDDIGPGSVVMVRTSWAKIHRAPDANSQPIALVFGNDVFQVEQQQGDWVQVRFSRNHRGWVEIAAVSEP